MKKTYLLTALLIIAVSPVFAINFSPTPMVISSQAAIHYDFDGSNLNIPVKITGTPSNTMLLVFTKDKGESISQVQNGFLGWHYVNMIDTCIYAGDPTDLSIGSHTIIWDGTDDDGNAVAAGDYT